MESGLVVMSKTVIERGEILLIATNRNGYSVEKQMFYVPEPGETVTTETVLKKAEAIAKDCVCEDVIKSFTILAVAVVDVGQEWILP